ncbi:hypothetical protein F7725_029183 [Dissostichus mawsoni]|uniref:Uncharacterized protein n=1 Tax=Dissostichus mawsoni TaxID=36200 RepID=A0A7J5XHQ9_DISMA|nr:hypothetical protein F7725_029183 [Dissostichus mawsoni]
MTLTQSFPLKNSGPSSTIKLRMALRILSLEKQVSSDLPSSVQHRDGEPYSSSPLRSNNNNLYISQKHLSHKDSTASLASDISLPFATLELQQRLRQLQKRTLDVAVKNGGSILSKHKGFLGKV